MKRYLVLCAAAVTLTACGGGGSSGGQSDSAGNADSFSAFVQTVLASSPEDTEPQAIDSVTATSRDDTTPIPLI